MWCMGSCANVNFLSSSCKQAIYNKSLKVSSSICAGAGGTGRLVNMMAADASAAMEQSVLMLLPVIVAPAQLIVYFALIFQARGLAVIGDT